ncbi:MAG: metal ABC transporter permease [Janthinobacterium lividum]
MLVVILTSILIALVFAPLGCLSLWKRYIYFSDGLAHASLLAGSISVVCAMPLIYSGLIVAILFAAIIFKFSKISGSNAAISLTSNLMLASALIFTSLNSSSVNINQLLFGDIISSSQEDLVILLLIIIATYSFIIFFFRQINLIVLSRDIALVSGIWVKTIELLFLVLLALAVLFSIKIVGSLLITSFLLVPALAARLAATTPSRMIILATIFAIFANMLGLFSSFHLNIPVAPAIIIAQSSIYLIIYLFYRKNSH